MSKPLKYQILRHARKLITNPKHWVRYRMFTVDGESYRFKQVTRLKRKPDRFCAAGAVYYANYELTGRKRIPLELHAIVGELAEVNDDKGHRPVLRKLDEMLHSI